MVLSLTTVDPYCNDEESEGETENGEMNSDVILLQLEDEDDHEF
jgi:hypothetical protein